MPGPDQPRRITLVTRWRVEASVDEVLAILDETEALPRWWPEVYLEARVLDQGDEDGIGRRFEVLTRGWLPYTLRWQGTVRERRGPNGWTLDATGDLRGEGTWQLRQDGATTEIDFTWSVFVEKRGLKPLTLLLRPVFAANHKWAMARGLEGLRRELARRRSAPTSD